jgi:hypothetical protein
MQTGCGFSQNEVRFVAGCRGYLARGCEGVPGA